MAIFSGIFHAFDRMLRQVYWEWRWFIQRFLRFCIDWFRTPLHEPPRLDRVWTPTPPPIILGAAKFALYGAATQGGQRSSYGG